MANNLHISYDLIAPDRNYDTLIAKIKELGGWSKIGYSFWYVKSTYTSSQARDYLLPVLDSNDKLYVVDATNGAASWHNLSREVGQYILDNWSK